jgi:hypothetical protein
MRSGWVFWLFGLPVVLVLLVLTIGGSRLLLDPTSATVTPCGEVVMRRHYPLAETFNIQRPWIRYVQTVTPMTPGHADGYLCREDNGHGQRYTHDDPQGFNKWELNHFAEACLSDPIGFVYEVQYVGYLFDALPLRPVSISVTVLTRGSTCNTAFRSESHEPR